MPTALPGFKNPIHDAQQTFRALLDALARPGMRQSTAVLTPPAGLSSGVAAACLSLFDLETSVWLQPGLPPDVSSWLLFHTGCQITSHPKTADFAVIWDIDRAPSLHEFHQGTSTYPEASTSLFIQLPALKGGDLVDLEGPGILSPISVDLPLPLDFWQQWQQMTSGYPLGVDIWCFADHHVLGLPRTIRQTQRSLSN